MLCSEVAVLPVVTLLVDVVDGLVLVGSGSEATLVSIWPCVTVVGEVMNGVLLIGSGVAASEGVGLPVGITVLVLLVVLSPVEKKVCTVHSEQCIAKRTTYIYTCRCYMGSGVASLPVVLVREGDGEALVGSSGMAASEDISLPVGSTVSELLVVLGSVEM